MINALFYLNKLSAPKSLTNFDFYQHEHTVGHEQIKKFSWTWTSSWVLTDKSYKGQGQRVKDHESCIDTGIYMASWENCVLVLLVSYCLWQQQVGVSAPWPTILMTFSILMQVVDLTQVWPDGLFEYISPKMQVEQHPRMKMSSELLLDQVTKLPKTEQQRTEQECHSVVPWSSCRQHLHHEDYLNKNIYKTKIFT